MDGNSDNAFSDRKHPAIATINDVITFRLHRLVAIGERAGHHWSERMFGISLNEWRLLALVVAHGPTRAGEMADAMVMDKSQLSRVIKALITKGLIRNTADPNDGRAIALLPTTKGRNLHDKVMVEVLSSNERVLAPLDPEEIEVLDRALNKMIANAQEMLRDRLEGDNRKNG